MRESQAAVSPHLAAGGGGYPDGRYVMVGSDAQTVAVVSSPSVQRQPSPRSGLNKDFFKWKNSSPSR